MDGRGSSGVLRGSERAPPPGSRTPGAPLGAEEIDVTVVLRRNPRAGSPLAPDLWKSLPRSERRPLSREEFARRYAADTEDLDAVRAFARSAGLRIGDESPARRIVHLVGPASALATAFGTTLDRYRDGATPFRGRSGPLHVPSALADRVIAVLGLDNRPQARTHFRVRPASAGSAPGYTPPEVAAAYSFPTDADGEGECVGFIELGGGFRPDDLSEYFRALRIPLPTVTPISVDGATNAPTGAPDGPDAEVELDLEVAGAIAPGASFAVYFAPNTDQGFVDAVSTAVHDTVRRPSVISISWGGPEPSWTAQARAAFETVLEDAAALGVTVFAAAGDAGADDGGPGTGLSVDFPASHPLVTGCGGTRLTIQNGAIEEEVVWNDLATGEGATGGGVSGTYARPSYQADADVPVGPNGFVGRGVPDVAGDADPRTGYAVRVDGQDTVIGGTSAVAPLWAALFAVLNQLLGAPIGFANPHLYADAGTGAFHDITSGGNGGYEAGPGWDACTGLGSPEGAILSNVLRGT